MKIAPVFFFTILTIIWAVTLTCCSAQPGTDDTAVILDLLTSPVMPYFDVRLAQVYRAGVKVALFNAEETLARRVSLEQPTTMPSTADEVEATLAAAVAQNRRVLAILGPSGDSLTEAVLSSPTVAREALTAFAPRTGFTQTRRWNPNLFFTTAEPMLELAALIQYIVNALHVRRVGVIYTVGGRDLSADVSFVSQTLKEFGVDCFEYTHPFDGTYDPKSLETFLQREPQAIILHSQLNTGNKDIFFILEACLIHPLTQRAHILTTSRLRLPLIVFCDDYAQDPRLMNSRVVFSSSNPSPKNTAYSHIQAYRSEVLGYIKSTGDVVEDGTPMSVSMDSPLDGDSMLKGWLAGKVLARTLQTPQWAEDARSFSAALFGQTRFLIEGDYLLGDYGGECAAHAHHIGATCHCNQGAHTVFLAAYTHSQGITSPPSPLPWGDAAVTSPPYECYANGADAFPIPVVAVVFSMEDDEPDVSLRTVRQIIAASAKGLLLPNVSGDVAQGTNGAYYSRRASYGVMVLNTSGHKAASDYAAFRRDYVVHYRVGPAASAADVADFPHLFLSPMFTTPLPHSYIQDTTAVALTPTLEQQFHLSMMYLADKTAHKGGSSGKMVLLTIGYDDDDDDVGDTAAVGAAIQKMMSLCAAALELPKPDMWSLSPSKPLSGGLLTQGVTWVLGLRAHHIPELFSFLVTHPRASVILSYDDFAMYYDDLVLAARDEPDQEGLQRIANRLLTVTNLPLWSSSGQNQKDLSPLLQRFYAAIPDKALHTPRALEAFVTSRIIQHLVNATRGADLLADALYSEEMITLYDSFTVGPFTQRRCDEVGDGGDVECHPTRNYGARDITVVSVPHLLHTANNSGGSSGATAVVFGPATPDVAYLDESNAKNKKSLESTTMSVVMIAVFTGCAVAGVVAIAVIVSMCSFRNARSNSNAPKNVRRPVTLLFTDIESSTALWAATPQVMKAAVATHHKIIREVIARYRCYEVKTIGDSFMIACKKAQTGIEVAREIQSRLLKNDWKTDALDTAYQNFELRRMADNPNYNAPTAQLSPAAYSAAWRGLRVRIGVHTGLCSIRYDTVTKGYDYYGDTPNMAARTEAIGHGGQVLLTESTWWSLSRHEREALKYTGLGAQGMRGVPYMVDVFQLNFIPHRVFADLRTEIDAILPDHAEEKQAANLCDIDNTNHHTNSDESGGTNHYVDTLLLTSFIATPAAAAATVSHIISSSYSPFAPTDRIKALLPLLNAWNVGAPPRAPQLSDESYCRVLISKLAAKMSHVAAARQRIVEEEHAQSLTPCTAFSAAKDPRATAPSKPPPIPLRLSDDMDGLHATVLTASTSSTSSSGPRNPFEGFYHY